jgi:hypothetical protein
VVVGAGTVLVPFSRQSAQNRSILAKRFSSVNSGAPSVRTEWRAGAGEKSGTEVRGDHSDVPLNLCRLEASMLQACHRHKDSIKKLSDRVPKSVVDGLAMRWMVYTGAHRVENTIAVDGG